MKTIYWLLQLLLLITTFAQLTSLSESNSLSFNKGLSTGRIISSEIEGLSEPQEELEQLKMLFRQASVSPELGNNTVNATRQRPCQCTNGVCGCCSRILDTWKQKACVNITYDPDEFSFTVNMMMNDRVLYTRTVSGKNPRPICVPVPRIPFDIRACVRFYNIYFQGRNIHLCVNMEGKYEDTVLFKVSLDCLRFGANGLALLKPEDGGGLGQVELFPENENDDYEDEGDGDGDDDDDDDDDDDLF